MDERRSLVVLVALDDMLVWPAASLATMVACWFTAVRLTSWRVVALLMKAKRVERTSSSDEELLPSRPAEEPMMEYILSESKLVKASDSKLETLVDSSLRGGGHHEEREEGCARKTANKEDIGS